MALRGFVRVNRIVAADISAPIELDLLDSWRRSDPRFVHRWPWQNRKSRSGDGRASGLALRGHTPDSAVVAQTVGAGKVFGV